MISFKRIAVAAALLASLGPAAAQDKAAVPYDAELAKSLGANDMGMRNYVFVILKTGPNKMPEGEGRKKMFAGHFANMGRLAAEKKLVLAGPLDGVEGRRGIFVFNTADIEEAKKFVATDPVIINGEMVAEYHKFFASAALMAVNDIHARIQKPADKN
jgi:uncharacterized protein YciI